MTPLEENQEFTNTSGSIIFTTGEVTKPIVLEAISDKIPEFNEFFVLRLVNISGEFKIKRFVRFTDTVISPAWWCGFLD